MDDLADFDPDGFLHGTDDELDAECRFVAHLMRDTLAAATIFPHLQPALFCCGYHGRLVEMMKGHAWPDGKADPFTLDALMADDPEHHVWAGGGLQNLYDADPLPGGIYGAASLFFDGVARRFGGWAPWH